MTDPVNMTIRQRAKFDLLRDGYPFAKDALIRAIVLAGGQTALARELSTPGHPMIQAHVQSWLKSMFQHNMPPAQYCVAIEKITGVRCEELRPDIDWTYLRKSGCDCKDQQAAAQSRKAA